MSSKKSMLDELRDRISQQLPSKAPIAEPTPQVAPVRSEEKHAASQLKTTTPARSIAPPQPKPAAPVRSGRGMQFYLDDTDRKTINRLALWFGSQDRRVSDSQVVKAALRFAAAQQNARLLEIGDEVRASDRRLLKSKPGKGTK